jgi:anti-sigma factor RsiW
MNCSAFRDHHGAYLDDELDEITLVAVQRHIGECTDCARHDTTVRRALLLFRNMPQIEPSAEFSERLRSRLRAAHRADAKRWPFIEAIWPGLGSVASAAAGVVAAGYIAVAAFGHSGPMVAELSLAPVVALADEPTPLFHRLSVASLRRALPALSFRGIDASISPASDLSVWSGPTFGVQGRPHFIATSLSGR